jgi:hypothetical protein
MRGEEAAAPQILCWMRPLLESMVQDPYGAASPRRLADDRIPDVGAILHFFRVESDRDDRFQERLAVQPRILAIDPVDGDAGGAVDQAKRYFEAMVGFTQPFFITPCDGRKLR